MACDTVPKTAGPERARGFESHLLLQSEIDRFWSHVQKGPDCWLWDGARTGRMQYGSFRLRRINMSFQAHRLAHIIAVGSIADRVLVLHKCDVPLCCRPEHLFEGTVKDNHTDALMKGRIERRPAGLRLGQPPKISGVWVPWIRAAHVPKKRGSREGLARMFGVSVRTITSLIRGDLYRWA